MWGGLPDPRATVRPTSSISHAPLTDVAHAPSNVKDAAAGKSFIFIPIVARPGAMGTLLRAVSRLVSTPSPASNIASSPGVGRCVRHTARIEEA